MITRRLLLTTALAAALPLTAQADEPTKVVATFSVLGDMVDAIGGDAIELTSLVGPDGDSHVYSPSPQDAKAVSEADVLIINGLEFEGWLERLTEAASFDGKLVVATDGIQPITFDGHDDHAEDKHDGHVHDHAEQKHDDHGQDDHAHGADKHDDHAGHDDHDDHAGHNHGAFDPHAWLSPTLAATYVDNITAGLAQAAPESAASFYENRAAYVAELETLNDEITAMMAALPADRRTLVTSHDAFQYFARDYGLTFLAPQGLSTESEASAKDVATLIEFMRAKGIAAVFVESIADSRLLEQIADETGASVGGKLYPGALSDMDGPASTYLDMMRHNATMIAGALGS